MCTPMGQKQISILPFKHILRLPWNIFFIVSRIGGNTEEVLLSLGYTKEQILEDWKNFSGKPQELKLPHAPEQFITYFEEDNRPQAKLDRDIYGGMGITLGRLREDTIFDYKFVGLSHNTLRGAAGGAVLIAELLYKEGYFN